MTEFHNPGEVELSRDNLVWTVSNWGYAIEIEFDVMVHSEISEDWSNVFHMIAIDHDNAQLGSRLPSFNVWNGGKKFEICFSVNGNDNYPIYIEYQLNQWYHFQISQLINPTGGAVYRIRVNGNTVHEIPNSKPKDFPEAKLYLSNPWLPSLGSYGTLSNLTVKKEGKISLWFLIKEYIERRHGEPFKFLFLPKMGLLGSQTST